MMLREMDKGERRIGFQAIDQRTRGAAGRARGIGLAHAVLHGCADQNRRRALGGSSRRYGRTTVTDTL